MEIIRATDLEKNSDAITMPDGSVDGSVDGSINNKDIDSENKNEENKEGNPELIKEDIEPNNETGSDIISNNGKEEDISKGQEKDIKEEPNDKLDNISDEDLNAMSDDELDKLLSDLERENEEDTSKIDSSSSDEDIKFALKEKDALLSTIGDRLESKIKENADLKVQLAEKNIFNGDGSDDMIIFESNISKARDGDESAKKGVLSFLDKIRKEITGKTFGEHNIDKETDKISESNSVVGGTNPSNPSIIDEEDKIKVL